MALNTNELRSVAAGKGSEIRMVSERNKVGTLAAVSGAPLLPKGCPLSWDSSASFWVPYTQPSDAAVYTITSDGTPATAGVFLLAIDGLAVEVAFDADAAGVDAAVNAVLADAGKGYQISSADSGGGSDLGDASHVVTMTFDEAAGAPSVSLDPSQLTGNAHVLAQSNAGTQLNGSNKIRGFIQDVDGIQSSATEEVQMIVMLEGEVHRDDINTSAIRAVLPGAPSEAELDAALQSQALRDLSLHVRGLADVS